ncbi:MAG: tetratricopeptide repeat protein [Armatimonadota bacterium]|nr:tetratricopeptide repeat protein [Armatimonadota bacterium]
MNTVPIRTERPADLNQRAQTLIDLGRPDEAVTVLLQSLSQSPEDYRALCLLSLAHGKAGNLSEAERCAEQAIKAAPDKEWGYRLLAKYLLEQGAPYTALPAAEEAARLMPEEPRSLHILATAQRLCGKRREAEQTAERLCAVTPDTYRTYETLTLIAMRGGKWREAEAHARRALALDPNESVALNNLGAALSHQVPGFSLDVSPGPIAEAFNYFFQAITHNPEYRLAFRNLRETLRDYLLVSVRFIFWLSAIGFLTAALLGMWAGPTPLWCYGLLLVLGGAVLALAVRLSVLARRRLMVLPPHIQDFWRRTRRQR